MREEAPAAALILAEQGVFAPHQEAAADDALPEQPGTRFSGLYVERCAAPGQDPGVHAVARRAARR